MDLPFWRVLYKKLKSQGIEKEKTNMKRVLTCILILALILALGMATAYAAGPRRGRSDAAGTWGLTGRQWNWQDANGDGICDNCGRNAVGCSGYADQDGDGICDNCGMAQGRCQQAGCPGYVDLDGDGVCDNRVVASRGCHNQGSGLRHGCRR